MNDLEKYDHDFSYVEADNVRKLLSGIQLDGALFGLFSHQGGEFLAHEIIPNLYNYLVEMGVNFQLGKSVSNIRDNRVKLGGLGQADSADWILVTGGHDRLLPDKFANLACFNSYYAKLRCTNSRQRAHWLFAPAWVDLGVGQHLWGLPPNNIYDFLVLGAGSLTHEIGSDKKVTANELLSIYQPIIKDIDGYELLKFMRITYHGRNDGQFLIARQGHAVGLVGDCGHGFKFAAQNAKFLVDALATENFGLASRKLRGEMLTQTLVL